MEIMCQDGHDAERYQCYLTNVKVCCNKSEMWYKSRQNVFQMHQSILEGLKRFALFVQWFYHFWLTRPHSSLFNCSCNCFCFSRKKSSSIETVADAAQWKRHLSSTLKCLIHSLQAWQKSSVKRDRHPKPLNADWKINFRSQSR